MFSFKPKQNKQQHEDPLVKALNPCSVSKEQLFDEFLVDLFGNNQNLTAKLGLKDLTLDKQLIIQTAKK